MTPEDRQFIRDELAGVRAEMTKGFAGVRAEMQAGFERADEQLEKLAAMTSH